MKTTLTILSALFIAAIIGLILTEAKINRLEAQLSNSAEKLAQIERNEAERHTIEATRIDTLRSVVYRDRVRTQTEWRELIRQTPTDSVVYARLDSCIQVGSLVLTELALADSARLHLDSALFQMRSVVHQVDSALVREQGRSARFKRQRNAAIGAALIALIVGVVI